VLSDRSACEIPEGWRRNAREDRADLTEESNSPVMLIQEGRRRRCARKYGVDSEEYRARLQSDRTWEERTGGWRRRFKATMCEGKWQPFARDNGVDSGAYRARLQSDRI
jgi:hypothetical protein